MSAPNLVILALSCVKLSSGQGLVYQPTDLPTDMSKAIYPHFVEGGHNNVENTEIACTEQFILFPQYFLPFWRLID